MLYLNLINPLLTLYCPCGFEGFFVMVLLNKKNEKAKGPVESSQKGTLLF